MGVIKKEIVLEGLGCAGCAMKMERGIKSLDGIKDASIDLVSKKLTMHVDEGQDYNTLLGEITKIVTRLEPHVRLVEEKHKSNHHGHQNHCDCTDHKHEHDHGELYFKKNELALFGIGAVLFAAAVIADFSKWTELSLFLTAYVLVGGKILVKSLKNIFHGEVFDENFLMSIATIGAFAIGEYPEGVAVMLFYQIGELFQAAAVDRSRKSIKDLMDIRPDFANLKAGDDIIRVSPEEVKIGHIIIVKPGEKIPLDGKVLDGKAMLDTSALTGESVPRAAGVGDDVLAGFINTSGVLMIEVSKEFGESTVSKILDLVQNAGSKKAPTENFITKFARYYTPAVVFISVVLAVLPPLFVEGAKWGDWLYRALVFLVVSCPCALVVSIPLGFFGGIGGASKQGILIKGSNYLEALNNVDTVVFDKTGTLTKGVFNVTKMIPANGIDENELLEYAAYAESYSNHPIAVSIKKAYEKEINANEIENYEEISGHGIKATIRGKKVLAGSSKLMDRENIIYSMIDDMGTVVHIALNDQYAGAIIISDEVKADSAKAIWDLKRAGIKKTVMLTGDNKAVGMRIGKDLVLDQVYSELLPDQKVEKLEMLYEQKTSKGKIVFVGDGINDAPVLARADIGIAMGGLGSDAAIEAADVVIMTDEPSKIVSAIKIAKRTKSIVWQNIIFALGVKVVVLALGAAGIATMWEAVFADVGVALIAVLNAMRVMKVNNI